MERVVFLDRDGTLNEEVCYLYRPEAVSYTHLSSRHLTPGSAYWNPCFQRTA